MRGIQRRILTAVLRVVERPKLTLVIATAALAACAVLAMVRLNISADQNKLFSPKVGFFADYLAFDEKFPENEAIYAVVEAIDPTHAPPAARWAAAADAIAAKVRALGPQVVRSVDARAFPAQMGRQGLLLDNFDRLPQRVADVRPFVPLLKVVFEKPSPLLTQILGPTPIDRLLSSQTAGPGDAPQAQFMQEIASSLQKTLAQSSGPLMVGGGLPDMASVGAKTPEDLGYYYVPDASDVTGKHRLLLVRIYPNRTYNSLTAISDVVEQIRRAVHTGAEPFSDQFKVGVTGRPALEADEMRTSDRDSHRAEIVALCFVFVGLWFMLRSIWLAIVAEIGLAFGIGWTFGWATMTVGELNLLSIVFLIALIGIGMDYLVQILVRYRQEASRHTRPDAIFCRVFRHVGPPINTACLGAAGAFLVAALTDFRGAAQLGIIAGGGLLLCLLSGYTVVPAILTLLPARVPPDADSDTSIIAQPAPAGGWWLMTPVLWMALLAIGAHWAVKTEFDPNLLNLQAPHLESVKLLRKLQTWSGVVLSKDLDLLRRVRSAVEPLSSVAGTESALGAYDNSSWLHENAKLPAVDWSDPTPVGAGDLGRLTRKVTSLADKFEASAPSKSAADRAVLESATQVLRALAQTLQKPSIGAGSTAQRLTQWQKSLIPELQELLAQFDPGPPRFDEIPDTVRSHFVADDGTYALYIYPRHDLWIRHYLKQFEEEVESAARAVPGSPPVTGISSNIYHTTGSIQRAFYQSTIYALVLIFILVLIDLRNLKNTLLAISVLALGLPMLVAIMGILDVDWNFANFFGLPILIGAGHEYGVFMVHRYLEARKDPRRTWRRWDSSDSALLLCAYVTCSSFGFFWLLASHRGLKSLGLVMTLGTACIYLATIVAVRPVLLWRLKRRRERGLISDVPALAPVQKGPKDDCPPG